MRHAYLVVWLGGWMFAAPASARVQADTTIDPQFAALLALLPENARSGARLLIPDRGTLAVHREGWNAFVCRGDGPGDARYSALCYHRSLEPFLALQLDLTARGVRGAAFREQLCREVGAANVHLPEIAYMIDVSGTLRGGQPVPDSVTIYHMVQVPYATEQSIGVADRQVRPGLPWLHHAGTCDAHIMWSERRAFREPSPSG